MGSIVTIAAASETCAHVGGRQKSRFRSLFYAREELAQLNHLGILNHHNRLVCKLCYPDIKQVPRDITNGGKDKAFVISQEATSDKRAYNNLAQHVRTNHKEMWEYLKPMDVRCPAKAAESQSAALRPGLDVDLTELVVKCLVIKDLEALNVTDRVGMRHLLDSLMPGCGGRFAVTSAFERIVKTGKTRVTEVIAEYVSQDVRFTITGDAWKNKGRVRRHYHALMGHFVDHQWQLGELCLGVVELGPKRDHVEMKSKTLDVLRSVGLSQSHVFALMSDHAGAIRKGFDVLYKGTQNPPPIIGCGCHLIQLPLNHVVPKRNMKEKRAENGTGKKDMAEDAGESSESSEESSDPEEEEEASEPERKSGVAEPEPKRKRVVREPEPAVNKKGRKPVSVTDPERHRIMCELQALFKKIRELSSYFWKTEDAYNALRKHCLDKPLPFKNFAPECPSRWASTYEHLVTHLHNARGLASFASVHKIPKCPKNPLGKLSLPDEAEYTALHHVAVVLSPMKTATRVFDGQQSLHRGGHYLPMMHTLLRYMGAQMDLKLPPDCDTYSFIAGSSEMSSRDLVKVAADLRAFICRDFRSSLSKFMMKGKTNKPNPGCELLQMASFLDPRHKELEFMTEAERAEVHSRVRTTILQQNTMFGEEQEQQAIIAQRVEAGIAPEVNQNMEPYRAAGKSIAAKAGAMKSVGVGKGNGRGSKSHQPQPWLELFESDAVVKATEKHNAREHVKRARFKRVLSETDIYNYDFSQAESAASSNWPEIGRLARGVRKDILWYLQQEAIGLKEDPLVWWKDAANKGRISTYTQTFVKHLFAIPGSTATLERAFSSAGRAITMRRASLKPTTAADIVFAHENMKRRVF